MRLRRRQRNERRSCRAERVEEASQPVKKVAADVRRLSYHFCFRGNLSLVTSAATGSGVFQRAAGQTLTEWAAARAALSSWISPSPPSDGGEGWGEEVRFYWFPLSLVLSPLVPPGARGA